MTDGQVIRAAVIGAGYLGRFHAQKWAALPGCTLAAIVDPSATVRAAIGDTFQLTFIPGIMRRGMWRGLIESVHVSPEHRNKGLGKAMMGWAIEQCRARGCGMVQLTSNKKRVDAHRFYRTLGFAQSHEGFKFFL